jgi:tRNA-specific 2-thiouridylase
VLAATALGTQAVVGIRSCNQVSGTSASWVSGQAPEIKNIYASKTRYRQTDAPCLLSSTEQQIHQCEFELSFTEPQWAVTPGQSAVLYDGEICLGGGIIV